MPDSSATFKADLEAVFTSNPSSEADAAGSIADAIAKYFMGVKIGSLAKPAVEGTKGLIKAAALTALSGMNVDGAFATKLSAAVVAGGTAAAADATAAATVTGVAGVGPTYSLSSPSDSAPTVAQSIVDATDTALTGWTGTNVSTGASVTGWT